MLNHVIWIRSRGRIPARVFLVPILMPLLLSCGHSRGHGISPTLAGLSAQEPGIARQPTETTLEAALAELNAIPVPAGVDDTVFAELRSALTRALHLQWGASTSRSGDSPAFNETTGLETDSPPKDVRLTSTPATGESNRIDDLELTEDEEGQWRLSWRYRCAGDYDQNGLVDVADIVPLAVHFGQPVGDDPLNEVIDGNGDGVVGIADITPIARSFLTEVFGYRIESASQLTGPFELVDAVRLPEGERTERLRVSFAIEGEPANFYRVVPEDPAGELGDPSNLVGLPPKILDVSPLAGDIDSPFGFAATVRGAPPIAYHWTFGDNAAPGHAFEEAPSVSFLTTGMHPVTLAVSSVWGSDAREFAVQVVRRGDWSMFGHDPQHTGRSPYRGPQQPVLAWSFQAGEAICSSAAVAPDGTVYFRSDDMFLYALDAFGQTEWTRDVGPNGYSSPAVADDGSIYVGSDYGYLACVRPDGTAGWTLDLGGPIHSPPVISPDGIVYVGDDSGAISAVIPGDEAGTIAWSFPTGGAIEASPALGFDGTIYVASGDGFFYAVNPDGSLKWRYATGAAIIGSASVGADGAIYVGSTDGYLYAFAPDGTVQWAFATGYRIDSMPALGADGTVYIGNACGSDTLFAVNPDGSQKWRVRLDDDVIGAPVVDVEGTVYVATSWRGVIALTSEGAEKWVFKLAALHFRGSPIIGDDGHLYTGNEDGKLYVLGESAPYIASAGPTEGEEREEVQFSSAVTGTPPLHYYWDFGGAGVPGTSELASPTVTLGAPGTYTVSVRVANFHGEDSLDFTFTVTPLPGEPPVIRGIAPQSGFSGTEVTFVASVSGDPPFDYWWDFGGAAEPNTSDLPAPVVMLGAPGIYTVSLQVVNLYGEDDYSIDFPVYAPLNGDWWMYGREPKHQRCSPFVGPESPATKWDYFAVSPIECSPVMAADGTIYLASTSGVLRAISPEGHFRWSFDLDSPVYMTPAVAPDGTIYVGTLDRRLVALYAGGNLKWTFTAGGSIYSSPAIAPDGTLYFGCSDGNIYALSADGARLWTFATGGWVRSSPAIGADGTVYVGSEDGYVYAITPEGSEEWRFTPESPQGTPSIWRSPTVGDDGTIYLPIGIPLPIPIVDYLYAINPDGTEKWCYKTSPAPTATFSDVAIGPEGNFYFGNAGLHAFSGNDDFLWYFPIPEKPGWDVYASGAAPVVDTNRVIYLSSYYCDYDPNTGRWDYEGMLFAVNPDGTEKWRLTTSTVGEAINTNSPSIGEDGTIYLASRNGYLYAIGEAD